MISLFIRFVNGSQISRDIVKEWDSTMDGATRYTHRLLDGQIREQGKPFEAEGMEAQYPGEFGIPSEDINCRCCALTRAKWGLDEDELKRMQAIAEYFQLDKSDQFESFRQKYLNATDQSYMLRGKLPVDYVDTRKIGNKISEQQLNTIIENARLRGVQIGYQQNPTGGFENYCGSIDVLNKVIQQTEKQLNSKLFMNSKAKKIILLYDNILDGRYAGDVIDVNTFAVTKGNTITINKFMYDDSAYLEKQYAESQSVGFFPKGTNYNSVISHEAGHIIDKNTSGLRIRVLKAIAEFANDEGISIDKYIRKNISEYADDIDSNFEYHQLVSELNSMLNSENNYDIIQALKERGTI